MPAKVVDVDPGGVASYEPVHAPNQRRELRILHLTTDSTRVSGAEQLLIGFGQHASRFGWRPTFATLRSAGPVNRAFAATGWPSHGLGLNGLADVAPVLFRLFRLVRALRPDLVHTHLHHASVIGAMLRPLISVPLFQTRHYSDYLERFGTPVQRTLDRWAARRCAGIAAVSDAARGQLVEKEGVDPSRVTVVENGVDWDRLARRQAAPGRATLRRIGVPDGPLIACMASLQLRKGHATLIDALARIRQRVPEVQLVLLGAGPEEAAIRRQADLLGLADRVHLLGHRDDAHDICAAADVYAQPSLEEGFGLAVIEAMAMRCPVVVSDVGGMTSTVEDGVSGLRVPPGEPGPLGEAITALLVQRERAERAGALASERVRSRYSLTAMLARYDACYRTLLGEAIAAPPVSEEEPPCRIVH